MSQVTKPFNVMAKPVCGRCNLDCRYCYYTPKPTELYPDTDSFLMAPEVLESYTRQYLAAQPSQCEFGWQGGEPTLAGVEFYRKALQLQRQYAAKGQKVTNALQTNGTLLNEEWAEFLAAEGFLVGISLDGPPQWHNTYRVDHAGRGTFHRAWAGLELLRDHGVQFNVLVTLNKANAPHAGNVYRYFVNRGIQYIQFIPLLEQGKDGKQADFSCTAEQFGRFMIEVFDLWASNHVGRVSERFIDNCLHQILFKRASMCCYAERCASAYVLEFNGDLYACDHFVFKPWLIGNIMTRTLVNLAQDPKIESFAQLKTDLPSRCRECEFLEFCSAGCPKHHRPIGTDPDRVNHFCEGYKMFFSHALPELRHIAEGIRQQQFQAQQSTLPPSGSPSDLPSGATPPGRNDPCPCGSGRKYKNCCGRTK